MSNEAWEAGVLPLNYARALDEPLAHKGFERKQEVEVLEACENERRTVAVRGVGITTDLPRPLRVLVCGGRDFKDQAAMARELDPLRDRMQGLLSGGAPGADTLAWNWGWSRDFPCERILADWKTHGRAAGPIRNQRMIDEWNPTLVIAFSGGRGTADMIRRAKAAGIEVREVSALPAHQRRVGA